MSNQAERLAARGGRRVRKSKYVEIMAVHTPINTVTKLPTNIYDEEGNKIGVRKKPYKKRLEVY